MKRFNIHNRPAMIITVVVILSIIAGAGAMAALAGNPSDFSSPEDIGNRREQTSETQKRMARKQAQIAKNQAQIAKKHAMIARKQAQIAKKHAMIARKQAQTAQKQAMIAQKQALLSKKMEMNALLKEKTAENRQNLYAMHKKRNKKKSKRENMSFYRSTDSKSSDNSSVGLLMMPLNLFKTISISGIINVVFTQGESDGYAEIHGDQNALDHIRFAHNGYDLNIGYNSDIGNISTRTIVYITSPELEGISLTDVSSITVQGTLKTDNLYLSTDGATDINIPHLIGRSLNINASGASVINVMSSEMESIDVQATDASNIKLKGVCARTVTSCAREAAGITISGRCNMKQSSTYTAGVVRDQGLIIENNRLDCNPTTPKKKTMPRKP